MSENKDVEVPFDGDAADNATLLLAAAEELGYDQSVVRTAGGAFVVPSDVHDKAFGKSKSSDKTPAKKAAKKAPAKKAASKSTTTEE